MRYRKARGALSSEYQLRDGPGEIVHLGPGPCVPDLPFLLLLVELEVSVGKPWFPRGTVISKKVDRSVSPDGFIHLGHRGWMMNSLWINSKFVAVLSLYSGSGLMQSRTHGCRILTDGRQANLKFLSIGYLVRSFSRCYVFDVIRTVSAFNRGDVMFRTISKKKLTKTKVFRRTL